tara:strand:- start:933 stop:1601 length:669 start_codon:yes stop_codon:yes gene_type:complete
VNVVDIMAQPRKAMKSLGFQGCCLRCDAVDKSGLLRCKICIDYHKKIKNIIIGNDDSVLIQHMRELYSMLSKPEMFDNDEIHGEELTYQQSLIGSVSFDGGYVYPEDISELYNKNESQSKRLLQDLGSKNVWKNNPPSNEIAKMIGDETWTDEELAMQNYDGKRTIPSKTINPTDKNERVGEDRSIGVRSSIEDGLEVQNKNLARKKWDNLIDELDEILDDL